MNLTQSLRVGIIASILMITFSISGLGSVSEGSDQFQIDYRPNYTLDENVRELYSSEILLANQSSQLGSLEINTLTDPRSTSDCVRSLGDYEGVKRIGKLSEEPTQSAQLLTAPDSCRVRPRSKATGRKHRSRQAPARIS